MTALPQHRMTADEFLAWAEAQPKEAGRCVVVDMPTWGEDWMAVSGKLAAYLGHSSIQHYIVIDPDKPMVIHYRRVCSDHWATQLVSSRSLRLDPPGLDADLTELFELG